MKKYLIIISGIILLCFVYAYRIKSNLSEDRYSMEDGNFAMLLPDLDSNYFKGFFTDLYQRVDGLDTMPNSAQLLEHYNTTLWDAEHNRWYPLNDNPVLFECSLPFNIVDSKNGKVNFIKPIGADDNYVHTKCDYNDPKYTDYPYAENMLVQGSLKYDPLFSYQNDHHLIVIDTGGRKLYELYQLKKCADAFYHRGAAVFDLLDSGPRTKISYIGSGDAAGLPLLPLILRYDEVMSGNINHPLRLTVFNTDSGSVLPTTHWAVSWRGDATDPHRGSLPMGTRLRLRDGFPDTGFPPEIKTIIKCLKTYGVIVADNGSHFAITASSDIRYADPVRFPHYDRDSSSPSFWISGLDFSKYVKPKDFVVIKWGKVSKERISWCDQVPDQNQYTKCGGR